MRAQIDWLFDRSPTAAERAALNLFDAIDLLADFPRMGVTADGVIREKHVRFGRDGFVIRYRPESDAIVVLRIFHGRQDRP